MCKKFDKSTRQLFKLSLQSNKKGSGEDTFICGWIMPFFKNKLHKIFKKLSKSMKEQLN